MHKKKIAGENRAPKEKGHGQLFTLKSGIGKSNFPLHFIQALDLRVHYHILYFYKSIFKYTKKIIY